MRSLRLTALIAALFFLVSAAVVYADISLVPNAKMHKESGEIVSISSAGRLIIVTGKKPTDPETYAAERLKLLIDRRFHLRSEIVSETSVPSGADLYVYVGQKDTNDALRHLCDENQLAVPPGDVKPGADGYVLEVLPKDKRVLIQGNNPRSVIFGVQTLFKLMSAGTGKVSFPQVTIHDWPTMAWRGGCHVNAATQEELDAWAWAGFNFARVGVPRDGDWESVRKEIAEAHKRGLFIYAYRTTAVKQGEFDKVMSDYKSFVDAGVDGLWMSFDDYGPGDRTIPLMERVMELGRNHGMTGHAIAITPPYPDYDSVSTPFDRERSKIKGMDEALWFFTTVPSAHNLEIAKGVGIKSLPAWWHNWPRPEGAFTRSGYGGRDLRADQKEGYMEVPPLIWGWHHPSYGDIADAQKYTDTVLPCDGTWLPNYLSDTFGVWAWNPYGHDFVKTRQEVYDTVYGPKCVSLMLDYDDTHQLLREFFTPTTNAGGLPDKFPARLRPTADRKSCRSLIDELDSLTAQVSKLASEGSTLDSKYLESTYLEPMRAENKIIRALCESSFPENWWWDQQSRILQLSSTGQTEEATSLAKEDAAKLRSEIDKLDKSLSPLLNMKGYLDFWRNRAAACDAGDTKRLASLFHEQPGALRKDCDAVKKFKEARAASQPGTLIAQARPEELARTINTKGAWIASFYGEQGISAVDIAYPPQHDSTVGGFCEVSMKADIPAGTGQYFVRFELFCEPFSRSKEGYNSRQGLRSLQLLVDDKVVWEEDAVVVGSRSGLWRSVEVTDALASVKNAKIKLRVIDKAAFRASVSLNSPGSSEESTGFAWFDSTSYQTCMLVGPMQVWRQQ